MIAKYSAQLPETILEVEKQIELENISNNVLIARFIVRVRALMGIIRHMKIERLYNLKAARSKYLMARAECDKDVYKAAIMRKTQVVNRRQGNQVSASILTKSILKFKVSAKDDTSQYSEEKNESLQSFDQIIEKKVVVNVPENKIVIILDIFFMLHGLIGLLLRSKNKILNLIGGIFWGLISICSGIVLANALNNISMSLLKVTPLIHLLISTPLIALPIFLFFFNLSTFKIAE